MAKKRNLQYQSRFVLGDIRNDKILYDIDYDVVVLCEVLEHVENDLGIIENIIPKKRVIITLPSFDTRGHIRYFNNEKEVIDRYKIVTNIVNMSTVKIDIHNILKQKRIYYIIACERDRYEIR